MSFKSNITQNGKSPKLNVTILECHSNWNVTLIGMAFKMEHNSKWNVTQTGMSLKIDCHSNLNVI